MIDADVHKATSFWHPDTSPRPHFVFHIVTIDLSMSTYRYSDPNKRCQDVFPECELDIYLIFPGFPTFSSISFVVATLLHCSEQAAQMSVQYSAELGEARRFFS